MAQPQAAAPPATRNAAPPAAASATEADAPIGRRDRWHAGRRAWRARDGETTTAPVPRRLKRRQLVALGLLLDLRV